MNGLILGLYGIYLVVIGVRGEVDQLQAKLGQDLPHFVPWAIAIVILIVMSQTEATAEVVKPFVGLLILAFFLKNFGTMSAEVTKLRTLVGGQ
jgi:hypothetical protein